METIGNPAITLTRSRVIWREGNLDAERGCGCGAEIRMDQRLQAAAASWYILSMMMKPPTILLMLWAWGCVGSKPGPAGGETGGEGDSVGCQDETTQPAEGLHDTGGRTGSVVRGEDTADFVPDTDGPELWLLADDDPTTTAGHSWWRTIRGSGRISCDGTRFHGVLDYQYTLDDEVRCDLEITLDGQQNEEICEGCDYLFDIDTTITRDDSLSTCDPYSGWTLLSDGFFVNPHLGFAAEYDLYGWYGWQTYQDVLMLGGGYDFGYIGGEGYTGPYSVPSIFTGPYFSWGEAAIDDRELTWYLSYGQEDVAQLNHYQDCGKAWPSQATRAYMSGTVVSGTVDCNAYLMDGWSFEAGEGDVVTLTVDSPHLDNADFEPSVFVNGPDGCLVVSASENYVCTGLASVGSHALTCPSARFRVNETGTHEIWIRSNWINCSLGATVDYALYVDVFLAPG